MNAPVEFMELGLDPHAFHYSDKKSWRGPCPYCGGHRRFVMFTNNEWPLWNGYCDECGKIIKAWLKVQKPVDPAKLAACREEQEQEEQQRAEYRRQKLSEFTAHELWAELSERMTDEHIAYWESQGVPMDLQRYLRIGFTPDKIYRDDDQLYHSPAYTIPWFGYNFAFETMQYRLMNPVHPEDRYRFEDGLGGGGTYYYTVDPSDRIGDKVIICEGAKKAIVTWQWLAPQDEHFTIIAAASNNTLAPALEATKDCGQRYLVLDPGSEKKMWETARKEKNMKAVYLPGKIDDLYLAEQLNRQDFTNILRAL